MLKFINTITKQELTYDELQKLPEFKGVGWPLSPNIKALKQLIQPTYDILPEKTNKPTVLATQKVVFKGWRKYGSVWKDQWDVVDKTAEELDADFNLKMLQCRNDRATLYPEIGEQLDAILKYLLTIPEDVRGEDLNNLIKKWQDVKTSVPKPSR